MGTQVIHNAHDLAVWLSTRPQMQVIVAGGDEYPWVVRGLSIDKFDFNTGLITTDGSGAEVFVIRPCNEDDNGEEQTV